MTVYAGYEDVMANIDLSTFVEKRFLYVLLDYVCFVCSIIPLLFVFYYCLYFFQIMADLYAIASV